MTEEYSLQRLWKNGTDVLQNAGVEEARLDAWLLLEYISGVSRAVYYAHPEIRLTEEQVSSYEELIRRRSCRIPLQHITHQAFFMGHEFFVDERVLIPRQDTELLAELAIALLQDRGKRKTENTTPKILDMCTGSGCILISILLAAEEAEGLGADISADALCVAEENAKRLGVDGRASFVKSDLFSGTIFLKNDGNHFTGYDMIVSNPPYIASAEIERLSPEVRLHDPRISLDGGEDGLSFYRRILQDAGRYLKKGGSLLLEIGFDQGEALRQLAGEAGYTKIEVHRDLAGKDRVVSAVFAE